MNKEIENIIKKWLKKHKDDGQYVGDYDGEFDLENCCLDGDFDLNDLADEVLKVVVEKLEKVFDKHCNYSPKKIESEEEFGFNKGLIAEARLLKFEILELLTNSSTLEGEQSEHLSPNKDNKIIHKSCGTKSSKGEYKDGTVDYLCHNCDVTFLDNDEQTIIS